MLLGLDWANRRTIDALRDSTRLAMDKGDWIEAEELARQWIGANPSDHEPWRYATQAALAMENPGAAVNYLMQMPPVAPAGAYLQLSLLQMQALDDPLAAKATCDLLIEYYPDDSENHERLLFYYTMTAQREQTAKEARRAIELGCDTLATYAYLLGAKWLTFTNGYETNRRWMQRYPDSPQFEVASVIHLPSYAFTDVLAQGSQPEGAVAAKPLEYIAEQVRELRKKYPQNLELLALETRDLCRNGKVEEVAERLGLQVPNRDADSRFWRFKGWYLAANEQWQDAISAYQQALDLDPLDWATQLEMAAALRASQGIAAAREMQSRADFGKALMAAVQACPNLGALEPAAVYEDMITYFRMCGQDRVARKLRDRLNAR